MVGRNIILALLLSFILTFVLAIVYALFPLISVMLREMFSRQGTGGMAAVAGGMSSAFFLITMPLLFLIIFAWLQRRR